MVMTGKGISLEQLRYAWAVSTEISFSAAARTSGVTQPALSNAIAHLERELGVRLFERTSRGVTATPDGRTLLRLVGSVLAQVDDLVAEANRVARREATTIRLGVSPLIDGEHVSRAFRAACRLSNPKDLVLREANRCELRTALERAELDMILVSSLRPEPQFEKRAFARDPMVVVHPGWDPSQGPVDIASLAGSNLVFGPDTCGLTAFTKALFEDRDLEYGAYPGDASSHRVIEEWARIGMATAILPYSRLSGSTSSHRPLVSSGDPIEMEYEALWYARNPIAADLETIADQLVKLS